MKNRIFRGIVVLGASMIVVLAAAPDAFAQGPLQAPDLTLKKTYVVTAPLLESIDGQNWAGARALLPGRVSRHLPRRAAFCLLKLTIAMQAWVNVGGVPAAFSVRGSITTTARR